MDIVDRIFNLVDAQYKEQRDFAAAIGTTPSMVSQWRRRKSASYSKYLPQIIETLNTTSEYLLTGDGPKTKVPTSKAETDAVKPEHIRAAFFEGAEDLSKEELDMLWDDARAYMQYKLEQRRKQKHDK
ncbi:helix-turn-helix domain-containing protein [Oscillibacter ruminantium]|uniref:helix-turn-helix domain-containing protein n=1 Tax=Oscillibacter ruminantium TaxID=1263547 RepID=UPI00058B6F8B|nr:helix-turn-helix domain-containing protein [Oscillibacter ruminantium]